MAGKTNGPPKIALTTDAPEIPETTFRAIFNASMIRSVDDIWANIRTSDEQILDARGAGRFDGIDPEPRPECRSGHIPGSQNLPFNELIDPQMGTVLPIKELASRIQAAGIDDVGPVVTTCGSASPLACWRWACTSLVVTTLPSTTVPGPNGAAERIHR